MNEKTPAETVIKEMVIIIIIIIIIIIVVVEVRLWHQPGMTRS